MLGFKRQLLSWKEYIKRLAHLDALEVKDGEQGEFTLVARWKNGGVLEKHYDRRYVMGSFSTAPPLQQRARMKPCRFRDEFIRSVLNARGV